MSDDGKKKPLEGEIVTPQALAQILKDAKPPAIPQLDMLTTRFEGLLEQAMNNLDLTVREGFLGEVWGGIDYRIDVKAERIERLDRLMAGFLSILDKAEQAEQKIRAVNRECFEQYIDTVRAAGKFLEEQLRLAEIKAAAKIEEAKARAIIADYEAKIRKHNLEGYPPPPPKPLPPAPPPEDPRAKEKTRLQGELERLEKEQRQEVARTSGGKPESEWTEDLKEEVKRVVNMYFHAKEKIRTQLRSVL